MHTYTVCPYRQHGTKFYEIMLSGLEVLRLQTVSLVYFILTKFLSSKGAYNSQEKN